MSRITTLWAALLTRTSRHDGTDSPVELIANSDGADAIHYVFPDTPRGNEERAEANIYEIPVLGDLDTSRLDRTYFRVGIRGDDAWRPEVLALWCQAEGRFPVVPLTLDVDVESPAMQRGNVLVPGRDAVLSTDHSDEDKGDSSFALAPTVAGNRSMVIRGFLIAIETHNWHSYGTDSPVRIQITAGGTPVLDYPIPDTPQPDLEQGRANLYLPPADVPFTKASLTGGSIRVSIGGTDNWLPTRLFIFGLDQPGEAATAMVPLVHIGAWPYGELRQHGQAYVDLPIAP